MEAADGHVDNVVESDSTCAEERTLSWVLSHTARALYDSSQPNKTLLDGHKPCPSIPHGTLFPFEKQVYSLMETPGDGSCLAR